MVSAVEDALPVMQDDIPMTSGPAEDELPSLD